VRLRIGLKVRLHSLSQISGRGMLSRTGAESRVDERGGDAVHALAADPRDRRRETAHLDVLPRCPERSNSKTAVRRVGDAADQAPRPECISRRLPVGSTCARACPSRPAPPLLVEVLSTGEAVCIVRLAVSAAEQLGSHARPFDCCAFIERITTRLAGASEYRSWREHQRDLLAAVGT